MELKRLNEILGDLQNNSNLKFIVRQNIRLGVSGSSYNERVEGEEDTYYKIYEISGEDLFLRVQFFTDSYGSNPIIRGVNFVKKQTKTIDTYEIL